MDALDLGDALEQWIHRKAKQTANMSIVDKADIVNAGAKVFEKALREETNRKHRSRHNDKTFGHAADHIGRWQPKDGASGIRYGSYIVGWDNKYHAKNMLWINDGTKKLEADHFITNLRHDDGIRARILRAERAKYEQIIAKKKSGD